MSNRGGVFETWLLVGALVGLAVCAVLSGYLLRDDKAKSHSASPPNVTVVVPERVVPENPATDDEARLLPL